MRNNAFSVEGQMADRQSGESMETMRREGMGSVGVGIPTPRPFLRPRE